MVRYQIIWKFLYIIPYYLCLATHSPLVSFWCFYKVLHNYLQIEQNFYTYCKDLGPKMTVL